MYLFKSSFLPTMLRVFIFSFTLSPIVWFLFRVCLSVEVVRYLCCIYGFIEGYKIYMKQPNLNFLSFLLLILQIGILCVITYWPVRLGVIVYEYTIAYLIIFLCKILDIDLRFAK